MGAWRISSMALLIALGLLSVPAVGTAQGAPTISLEPSSLTIAYGSGNVEILVMARDLPVLAAFEVTIRYDSAVVSFASFQPGDMLGSTGRQIQCTRAVQDTGTVRAGCYTIGQTPAPPSGSGRLATFSFKPIASGQVDFALDLVAVADVFADDVPVARQGTSITVVGGPAAVTSTPSAGATAISVSPAAATTPRPGSPSGEILPVSGTPGATGQTGLVPDAVGTPGTGGQAGVAGQSRGGAEGGFPVAGYGPPPDSDDQPMAGTVRVLAVIGAVLAMSGALLRFRAGGRRA